MFLLKLTGWSPTNTALLNEDGKALYTISTTGVALRRTTYIHRHIIDAGGQPTDATEEMARIHWHWMSSSKLVWNGETKDIAKMMPRTGIMGSRVFTAPDGKQYKWRMRTTACQLDRVDGTKPEPTVVKTRQKVTDVFTRTKPALELDESLLPFLDLIVVTWVYIADEYERLTVSAAAAS